MLLNLKAVLLSISLFLPSLVSTELASGYPIGPLTTSDAKWAKKVCDVTKYGAVADGVTDLGPPLLAAFNACAMVAWVSSLACTLLRYNSEVLSSEYSSW